VELSWSHYVTDNQDADFDGAEPSLKKRKKNKKGKNKADEREEVDEAENENLTVAEKAKKVKKAMEEYKALDHEDMVCLLHLSMRY
jgi:protein KRI1